MKLLFVHPGPLLYTNVFLRLEPLGLELVAEAARRRKHSVRLIDLQAESQAAYHRMIAEWLPDFIAFSCNYLANVPEIVDLAAATKIILPRSFICVGGHSASFIAETILEHGNAAIDCVLKGEGEANIVELLEAVASDVKCDFQRARRCYCKRQRPSTSVCGAPRRPPARARPRQEPPQIFPRAFGPLRVNRIFARVSLGLCF